MCAKATRTREELSLAKQKTKEMRMRNERGKEKNDLAPSNPTAANNYMNMPATTNQEYQ